MFIHGSLGFISQGPFHNYSVPAAFQSGRDLLLTCSSFKRQMTKPALVVPKEPLTLQDSEREGNCWVKAFSARSCCSSAVRAVWKHCTSKFWKGQGGKSLKRNQWEYPKKTRNKSRKVFLLGGGAEVREAGLEMAGAVAQRRGEPL